jgi:Type I phosphodiesterase / nucleotide pyrophosphatase
MSTVLTPPLLLLLLLLHRICVTYRDLHTVDDGVLSKLPTELAADDWSVLVVHFLGVDHVGHTYGPATQAMSDKLDQMNTALASIFAAADSSSSTSSDGSSTTTSRSSDSTSSGSSGRSSTTARRTAAGSSSGSSSGDTLVLVMGDHGMTADGNHGGATLAETGAALLVYAPHNQHFLHLAETEPETEPKSDSPKQQPKQQNLTETGSARGVLSWAADSEALFSDAAVDSGTAAERSTRKVAQVSTVLRSATHILCMSFT